MKPLATIKETGKSLEIDVQRLIDTRLLVESNSGGGKSYLLRKILEVTHGQVQHMVLDMEGEFATLREKYDYILAGKDGDIPADPRSAELLARKILELGASIIIDLYELKQHERIRFVKLFLESLINSPKNLWHPVLVVLDEAHVFCPEHGESEAMSAVIDLATRGRKRGFGSIVATQRLSKFNKDAAAEFINKMIGRTGLDIDQKRAGDELGFTSRDDIRGLRNLEPGQFYAFGPALSKQIVLVNVDPVETTHPRAGERMASMVPTPTDKVLKVLAKLTDLPKEAEQELHMKEEMMRKIRDLKAELRLKPKPAVDEAELKRIGQQNYARGWKDATGKTIEIMRKQTSAYDSLVRSFKQIGKIAKDTPILNFVQLTSPDWKPVGRGALAIMPRDSLMREKPRPPIPQPIPISQGTIKFGACEQMILKFLSLDSNLDRTFSREQIGAMTNYSATSGSFKAALQTLKKEGLIVGNDQLGIIGYDPERLLRARMISSSIQLSTLQDWLGRLPPSDRKIYQVLYQNPSTDYSLEDLAGATGYSATSGSFKASISHLCTLGLAEKEGATVRFNQAIVEWL